MDKKEIGLIKRHLKAEKSTSTAVYGYYVAPSGQVLASFNLPTGRMDENEQNQFFNTLRNILNTNIGKNTFFIPFDSRGEQRKEQTLLIESVESELKDEDRRDALVDAIIRDFECPTNYLILLDFETMDLPKRRGKGTVDREADTDMDRVFSFFVCAICPVGQGKEELSYTAEKEEFHNKSLGYVADKPVMGFMFPTLSDRAKDVNEVLLYSKKMNPVHERFATQFFGYRHSISTQEKKREDFADILRDALGESCTMSLVDNMRKAIQDMETEATAVAKEEGGPVEPFHIGAQEIMNCLLQSGASEDDAARVQKEFERRFDTTAGVQPDDIMEMGKCSIKTEGFSVKVDASQTSKVSLQEVNGVRYIMIRADDAVVTINGVPVEAD